VYIQPLWRNWLAQLSNSVIKRKIRAITPFKVIQGHRGVEIPYHAVCDFLLVINTHYILSRTVSELSQLIFSNFGHCVFEPHFRLNDNVRWSSYAHWKACSGLPISVNWTFFATCYGWSRHTEEAPSNPVMCVNSTVKAMACSLVYLEPIERVWWLQMLWGFPTLLKGLILCCCLLLF